MVLNKKYKHSFWLNAADGTTISNSKLVITYRMAPYGSIILYASSGKKPFPKAAKLTPNVTDHLKAVKYLSKWNLKVDSLSIANTSLFDWRYDKRFAFSSGKAIYTSSFNWSQSPKGRHYILDLGKVYYTAEVFLNGKPAGKTVFAPYMMDITSLLQPGQNKIEVRVTPGQLNGFIGKGNKGDSRYKQFKGKDDQLMAAGLVGPVVIRESHGN
jgi:hypothetical protein